MDRVRVSSENKPDNRTVHTDVFVHGGELWRLQKTEYDSHTGKYLDETTMDFHVREFQALFPELYDNVKTAILDGNNKVLRFATSRGRDIKDFW